MREDRPDQGRTRGAADEKMAMKIPLRRERIRADEGVERLGVVEVGDDDAAGETPW